MIEIYRNLANNMPDNGTQVVMFNHSKMSVFQDFLDVFNKCGLKITNITTVDSEPNTALKKGKHYNNVFLFILRHETYAGVDAMCRDDILRFIRQCSVEQMNDKKTSD